MALEPKVVAAALDQHLRTDSFPLAIRVVRGGEAVPPKARRPLKEMGIQESAPRDKLTVRASDLGETPQVVVLDL